MKLTLWTFWTKSIKFIIMIFTNALIIFAIAISRTRLSENAFSIIHIKTSFADTLDTIMKSVGRAWIDLHTFIIDLRIPADTFTFIIFNITILWALLSYFFAIAIFSLIAWFACTKLSIVHFILSTSWNSLIFVVWR